MRFAGTITTLLSLRAEFDRINILVRNDAHWSLPEQLRGPKDPTHLGRVLHDLGIGYLAAGSRLDQAVADGQRWVRDHQAGPDVCAIPESVRRWSVMNSGPVAQFNPTERSGACMIEA